MTSVGIAFPYMLSSKVSGKEGMHGGCKYGHGKTRLGQEPFTQKTWLL